jgi:catechol 2,3-dioxygenase-like lactoylglutathione lyase family enzyme
MNDIKIDHIAIIVKNLTMAIEYFTKIGFVLKQNVAIKKDTPGAISAIVVLGEIRLVLLQATEANTCLTRYVDEYGYGVHHFALQVPNFEKVYAELEKKVQFDTPVCRGKGLTQVLGKRDLNSGIMMEIIQRDGDFTYELEDENVNELLQALE